MTSLATQLAERVLAPVGDEADALRTLTLTNVAAAVGDLGRLGSTLERMPLDADRTPSEAAFLFAARLHARTQDDFYPEGRVHVGAIALAATLALADEAQERTLECLAAGYRAMCAASGAYSTIAQGRGLRPSGVFGPFGAAASAARALGLDEPATVNAISVAAAAAGGHNQAWISGSDEWVLEVGAAARAGVEAALFTSAGIHGSDEAFEGRAAWAGAFFGEQGAPRLVEILSGPPVGADLVAVKPHPVSGIAQVPTTLACRARAALDGRVPEQVDMHVSAIEHAYPGSANRGPFRSRSDALMSIAFCVACGIVDGAVPLARLEDPNQPDIRAMLERVTVHPDEGLDENEARIAVRTDGQTIALHATTTDVLFPSWEALSTDVDELARRSEAPANAVRAAHAELSRETPDARVLRQILQGGMT